MSKTGQDKSRILEKSEKSISGTVCYIKFAIDIILHQANDFALINVTSSAKRDLIAEETVSS